MAIEAPGLKVDVNWPIVTVVGIVVTLLLLVLWRVGNAAASLAANPDSPIQTALSPALAILNGVKGGLQTILGTSPVPNPNDPNLGSPSQPSSLPDSQLFYRCVSSPWACLTGGSF